MNQHEGSLAFFPDELDSEVRAALEKMLSQTPDAVQLEEALKRLHGPAAPTEAVRSTTAQRDRWRLGITVAASFMLCLLWSGAQTETWGRVAQDFQRSTSPEWTRAKSKTLDTRMSRRDETVGSWRRFILIVHVSGFSIGLLGLFVTWLCSVGRWLITSWWRGSDQRLGAFQPGRIHLLSLIAYGCGIVLGCIWSQATWGVPWRWDPREALALITLGIATMWYATSKLNEAGDPRGRAIRAASIASLAWWMVALLYVLSGIYGNRLHSYGFPSMLPTIVTCLWGLNMLALFLAYIWRKRWSFVHLRT
ncbi:MAG: cytochrome c biogenesis protein CcsA [Pirellulaceae bacterium]